MLCQQEIAQYYHIHLQRRIYLLPFKSGLKIDMMNKNTDVCFEVADIENMNIWKCLILWRESKKIIVKPAQANTRQILGDRIEPFSTGETIVPNI